MRRPICALAFVFLHALLICAQSNPDLKQPGTILLEAGRVLDVQKGNYIQDLAILIEGDRIKEIGPSAELQNRAPKGTTVIELRSATILPGLIDCHTHLMARIPD